MSDWATLFVLCMGAGIAASLVLVTAIFWSCGITWREWFRFIRGAA